MYILGISSHYHDAAAALIHDGEIVAAAQEERFTRKKGDSSFPHRAIAYCLGQAGIHEDELDHVVFYENPLSKFERLITTYHLTAPFSLRSYLRALPSWLTQKLWLESDIAREMGRKGSVELSDHHLSHAASAFYPSPYDEAAILTIDGVGEWSTATWGVGRGHEIELHQQIRFPNSVGLLYSAFTHYLGFRINSGEYKVMGLAPYGRPRYEDTIRQHLIRIAADGSIALNQRYFAYLGGLRMTNRRFHDLFGGPPRDPESALTEHHMDIAASVQAVVDDVVMTIARHVHERSQLPNLVLAGGVALNVVAVGKLASHGPFESIWTQPAAGDAGGALGAALWMWHQVLRRPRRPSQPDGMRGSLLGPDIAPRSTADDQTLRAVGAVWETLDEGELQERIAAEIDDGQVVGVARGRMEWGPRALGARSILGDARSADMQRHLNLKIKFRESFRPFAPMVLAADAAAYFEISQDSPYMSLVFPVRSEHRRAVDDDGATGLERLRFARSDIPAVTHVDHTARVQTVDRARYPFMTGVLERFKERTGCSVIVNTSFNVRGEPIVATASDAYRCFVATDMDRLAIGDRFFVRDRQPGLQNEEERRRWRERFDRD